MWFSRFPHHATTAIYVFENRPDSLPSTSAAHAAVAQLVSHGYSSPSWRALAQGASPGQNRLGVVREAGEWAHGWQFFAADAVERSLFDFTLGSLDPIRQAMLRSQYGCHSGDIFEVVPVQPHLRPAPGRFVTCLRRRLWLPLGLTDAMCPGRACGRPLDEYGIHLLSCSFSGRLVARARPLERAWAQVAQEAGARVRQQVRVASLNFSMTQVNDSRTIDFVAFGLPVHGGLPLCCDPTLRSPLTADGYQRPGANSNGDATLDLADRAKRSRYADLEASDRCRLLPLACTTGGRWSSECIDLVRRLVRFRVEAEPHMLRQSYALAFQRRWWGLLSVALHESVAASLDPTDSVTELAFPPLDAVDVWLRDPPAVSMLGPR